MTPDEYLHLSETTERKFPEGLELGPHQAELLHAALGLATEAGEFADQIKRHLIYGAELDEVNLAEELGDLLWYAAIATRKLDISFEEIMASNIAKLAKRFPDKFSEENALHRDLDAELEALEAQL